MRSFLLIFTLLTSLKTFSAATQGTAVGEKEIEQFLGFYRSIISLKVDFKQEKKIKDMDIAIKSKGNLQVEKPDQVIWSITDPSPVQVSMNATEIRIESGKGAEKTSQVFKKEDMGQGKETQSLRALSSWMQMDTKLLSQEYNVTKLAEREFQFVPKAPEASPFEKMRVSLTSKKHIQSMILFEKSGDLLEITFAEPKVKFKK